MEWPSLFIKALNLIPYNKPHLSVDQQIELMTGRGMEITDLDKAKKCIERIGYYRLSAYWYPFRRTTLSLDRNGRPVTTVLDDYKDNTTFSTVLDIYVFDKKLRLLLLDALERVEVAVRTNIAISLGSRSKIAHRDPAFFDATFAQHVNARTGETKHQFWLNKFDSAYNRSKEEFVKHYKRKYVEADFPIWMAVELWDFGMLSHFFAGMRRPDKDKIANDYGLNGRQLETWLHCLNVARNICAHHGRLWNRPVVNQPSIPTNNSILDLQHVAADTHSLRRLYATLSILKFLLNQINPTSTWGQRLIELVEEFPNVENISLRHAGFPDDWKDNDIWQ